jgi:hypothetical protein
MAHVRVKCRPQQGVNCALSSIADVDVTVVRDDGTEEPLFGVRSVSFRAAVGQETNVLSLEMVDAECDIEAESSLHVKVRELVLEVVERFVGIGGEHHVRWVLDRVLRAVLGDEYEGWVIDRNADNEYDPYDPGIAP